MTPSVFIKRKYVPGPVDRDFYRLKTVKIFGSSHIEISLSKEIYYDGKDGKRILAG